MKIENKFGTKNEKSMLMLMVTCKKDNYCNKLKIYIVNDDLDLRKRRIIAEKSPGRLLRS